MLAVYIAHNCICPISTYPQSCPHIGRWLSVSPWGYWCGYSLYSFPHVVARLLCGYLRFRTAILKTERPLKGSFCLFGSCADKENRTPIFSLATRRFTTKLYPLHYIRSPDVTQGLYRKNGGGQRIGLDYRYFLALLFLVTTLVSPPLASIATPPRGFAFSRNIAPVSTASKRSAAGQVFSYRCSRQDSNLEYNVRSVA